MFSIKEELSDEISSKDATSEIIISNSNEITNKNENFSPLKSDLNSDDQQYNHQDGDFSNIFDHTIHNEVPLSNIGDLLFPNDDAIVTPNNEDNQSSINDINNNNVDDYNHNYIDCSYYTLEENGPNYAIYTTPVQHLQQQQQPLPFYSHYYSNPVIHCPEYHLYYNQNSPLVNIQYYVNSNDIPINGIHQHNGFIDQDLPPTHLLPMEPQQVDTAINEEPGTVMAENNETLNVSNDSVNNDPGESSVDSSDDSLIAPDRKDRLRNHRSKNHELNPQYVHQRFPVKLWNLASDQTFKPIRWSRDGLSVIINEHSLEPNLGYYFRSKKFSSFLRQLHLYGFRKVTRARNHQRFDDYHHEYLSEYQCNYFQRDNFDSVKKIRRYYSNSSSNNNNNTNSTASSLSSSQITSSSSEQSSSQPSMNNDLYHYSIENENENNNNNDNFIHENTINNDDTFKTSSNTTVYYHY